MMNELHSNFNQRNSITMMAGNLTDDENTAQLKDLSEQVKNLSESPYYQYRIENGYFHVFGEGNPRASVMLVGEAPGEKEAKSGRPFVGAAGKVLNELLELTGLERGDIYITNIVKDRPPENQNPTSKAIQMYGPYLQRQIDIVRPKVIVPLGRFALDYVLENFGAVERGKISELHGVPIRAQASYGEIAILPLYHPAAGFYNRSLKQTLEEDFQALKQFI
jgi:uracil-DNA glycosylase